MNVVSIGGGEIRQRETLKIDTFIRDLSGKAVPNVVFIPTASYDAEGYCQIVSEVYGKDLGCSVDHLKLLATQPTRSEIEDKVLGADIIYVGGGDTKTMLDVWKLNSLSDIIKQAGQSGTILSGLSAGAECWFEAGHSDYQSFTDNPNWEYSLLKCLAFKAGLFCPHMDEIGRYDNFKSMVEANDLIGIGCDNNAALWYQGSDTPRVVTSNSSATVKIIKSGANGLHCNTFSNGEYVPL